MYSGHTMELMMGDGPPTAAFVAPFNPSRTNQSSGFSGSCYSPVCQIQVVDSWPFVHRHFLGDILNLVLSESDDCECGKQYISRAQLSLTSPVPQSSANTPPIAMLFSFTATQFSVILWCSCNSVGLWSDLNVVISMVMSDTIIDSSKFSLWNSRLSISSANLQVNIIFIQYSDSCSDSRLSSEHSFDTCSDSGWALTLALTADLTVALTAAMTVAELWPHL